MKIKKLAIGLLIVAVSIIVIATVLLSILLFHYKHAVEVVIGQTLGADVEMDGIYVDMKERLLHIKNFKLHNPKGFAEEELLAYVPQITGEYNPTSIIIDNKLHFTTMNIYVKTLVVVKNKDGRLNVDQLKVFKEDFEELPIKVDRLVLTADYAISKDFTKSTVPHVETFDVKIKNATYEGFPSTEDITAKVVSEILRRTTVKGATLLTVAVLTSPIGGWAAIIPAETAVVLSDKDSYKATFNFDYEDVYQASLEAAHELGEKISEYKKDGMIKGYMNGADVTIKIEKRKDNKSDITVSARKHFFPKPSLAGGVLYEIAQKLLLLKKKI